MGDNETWLPAPGFEGLYEVSDHGRVRNARTGLVLRPNYDLQSYNRTALSKDGKPHYRRVCRLVAEVFIPNPDNKPQVNHKNGLKSDDHATNLEWVTASENTLHWVYELSRHYHHGHTESRFSPADLVEIRRLRNEDRWYLQQIAAKYAVSIHTIYAILNGKTYRDRRQPPPTAKGMPRGSNHPLAKLNEETVRQIKTCLRDCGDLSDREIAEQFGTTRENISQIKHGRSWRNVAA